MSVLKYFVTNLLVLILRSPNSMYSRFIVPLLALSFQVAYASSPSGTALSSASKIVDGAGNVWTLVEGSALENGKSTGASDLNFLLYHDGDMYAYASSGTWSQWYIFTSAKWSHANGDPGLTGTVLSSASKIIDGIGNVWTLVDGSALENDKSTGASDLDFLLYYDGHMYAYASSGTWSQWYIFTSAKWSHTSGDPLATSASNQSQPSSPPATPSPSLSATPVATSSHLSQSIPSSLFGIQTHGVTDWPTVKFGVLGKGSGIIWPYLESSQGVYNWSILDGYVSTARAQSIPLIYTFEGVPAWAIAGSSTATCGTLYNGTLICARPPDHMTDWTNYVTALVTRYCPSGNPQIQYYELWNEPYDVYGTTHVQISPTQLATMTHAAYNIIRSRCPSAKIISPDFSTANGSIYTSQSYTSVAGYAEYYFQALGPVGTDPVDIAAVHIYTYNQSVDTPEDLLPGGTLYSSHTISVLNEYAPGKPIWNTEGSWQKNGVGLFDTVALEAAFIARWYILHWAAGYEQANWYAWDDGSDGTLCKSISGACSPIMALTDAYNQTFNWLVGRTMYSGCSAASDGVTYICPLTGAGGYRGLLVWDTSGNKNYTPPSGAYTQYRSLTGSVTPYSGGPITIGVTPILIEN